MLRCCHYMKNMIRRGPAARERAASMAATVAVFGALVVAMLAQRAAAAELAVLSNGFSIRHEHRLVIGATTRLFLSVDDSSFTEVPTADITGFEKDLSLPLPVIV